MVPLLFLLAVFTAADLVGAMSLHALVSEVMSATAVLSLADIRLHALLLAAVLGWVAHVLFLVFAGAP